TVVLDGGTGGAAQILDNLNNGDALTGFATLASGGSFTIQNGRNFTPPGGFSNARTLTVGSRSTFTLARAHTETGTDNVLAGGTLVLGNGGSISGTITNNGTISIAAGTTFMISTSFVNAGTVNVAGTLQLTGGGSSSGAFSVSAGGNLNFSGGTY